MPHLSPEDVLPLHIADVTFPSTHPLRDQTGQILAFAIRHPRGLILFETGIGRGNEFLDTAYEVVHRSFENELARHGHGLGDVRAIANSHLHFDHCGNNSLFPGVPIYTQASEYEAAKRPMYTVPEWVDFPGAEYRLVEAEATIASGVRIARTPGHTVGHQSVVMDTGSGTVVLAGQAIYSKAEYDYIVTTGEVPPDDPAPDPDDYLASARRLIDLRPRRVQFSHDAAVWEPQVTNGAIGD